MPMTPGDVSANGEAPADTDASVAALARRYALSAQQAAQLQALVGGLVRDPHAPTTVRDRAGAVEVHLADSLVALDLDAVRAAHTIADLGAGAGFPGFPLAVALPRSEVVLVESQLRKCAFMERLALAAGVANASVRCVRAEEWREGMAANEIVLARAVAPAPVVLEYAAPLLALGGRLVDWRGRRNAVEERAAQAAAEQLGMRLLERRRVEPYAGAREHHLHIYLKQSLTPDRFPRRAGMARKRPLGGLTSTRTDRDRR
jgi:16S rRNA (guanine527-N7)-methyltransferase